MYILLVLVFTKCVLLYKLYNSIPVFELKRQARTKDKTAAALYKVAAYGSSLNVLLWLIGTTSAITLFIWSAQTSWLLATVVMALSAWLIIWAPSPKPSGWVASLAALFASYQASLLSFLQPVLGRVGTFFPATGRLHMHTGLYEKEDLLNLIKNQHHQLDNRIPQSDLKIVMGGLTFGDKAVGSVMTPQRKLMMVAGSDSIGPHLMDELHASGFSRFPVVKDSSQVASPQIVGTLYLKDLVGHPETGKVRDIMKKDVYFINESNTLREALGAFLKTQHHLLIVVNNFEELVGVLSIEDVVEQILGEKIIDEFERYSDLRAVAGLEARVEKAHHKEVKTPEQTTQTVVK